MERIESSDYPEEALREALLNALVHRDYSYSGSIIINVNDAGIEFISIGGLVPGLSADDIRSDISQPRNRKPFEKALASARLVIFSLTHSIPQAV